MKIEIKIEPQDNGIDIRLSENFEFHIFINYNFQNFRFFIYSHPLYFQQTEFNLRECFKRAVIVKDSCKNIKFESYNCENKN